ncbi:MAG: YbjQ family protein [Bacteroidales bacterium]|nr:YbjQ family protein [Bacteroidales bacterium]
MELYTVENIQGISYQLFGVVTGSTIQSKNMFSDLGQGLKGIVGGELRAYTDMMEKARKKATDRMVAQAQAMGADAVIGTRYTTSSVMAQAAEVLVYGTEIRYK